MTNKENQTPRALAYSLATIVDPKELDEVTGGAGPIIIPTVVLTGAPLIPDTTRDS